MAGPLLIDTNLLLLLVVGAADKSYIAMHKRLGSDYSISDWENLTQIISLFDEIFVLPNTLTEVSNFARHLADPARSNVQKRFQQFIEATYELYIESRLASSHDIFLELGLTDVSLIYAASLPFDGAMPTLISVDEDLLDRANSLGYAILDYHDWRD